VNFFFSPAATVSHTAYLNVLQMWVVPQPRVSGCEAEQVSSNKVVQEYIMLSKSENIFLAYSLDDGEDVDLIRGGLPGVETIRFAAL